MIEGQGLHTVCQEAACPNIGDCWERGTATFMILGDTCTRRCGFCNVKTGKPTHHDPLEPLRVAQSVKKMGLRHAVITSVDRDDLPDLGASAFVGVIRSIRRFAPGCKVEVLTPDFRGEEMPLARVIAERPDVFNHNVETVPRLYPLARRGSRFLRSCRVLRNAKEMGGDEVVTKSGLMTGLGETKEELLETFATLREHDVQVLTVGQYLRPTRDHLPVVRYWHPDEFAELEREAYALGFESVAAGPLVRSSYHAEQTLEQAALGGWPRASARSIAATLAARRRSRWLLLPGDGGRPQRPLAALTGRRSSAPRWRPRGSAASSTWSAASSASAWTVDGRGALRHPPGPLDARRPTCRSGSTTPPPWPTAGACTCTAATPERAVRSPPPRCSIQPRARPLAAAARAPTPRGRARRGGHRGPPLRGRRRQRVAARCARSRSTRLPPQPLAARAELPRPGAQPHDRRGRGRALLRAGRPRRREPHGGRALRPAPARLGAAAAAAHRARRHRLGARCATGGSWCSAARTWSRAARRSRRSSCSTCARGAGARCRTCSRRATGSAAPRSAARVRDPGRRRRRASTSERDRVPRRAVVPAQGRHPHAALPVLTRRDHRDLPARSTSSSSAGSGTSAPPATSACSSSARSPTRSPIRATSAARSTGQLVCEGSECRGGSPIRRPGT